MSLIDNVKIFNDLSREEKEKLSLFCQEREIQSGEILFSEGDQADTMYILASGSIYVTSMRNGAKVHLGKVYAEEILGEMALFGGKGKRMATAEAIENCKLIVILSFSIKELTSKYPNLLGKIQDIIEERQINNKIIESEMELLK